MHNNQYIKSFFLLAALALSACDPKIDNRGYVKNAEWKEHVIIGQTTKDQVFAEFGSPSSQSSFGDETWYYITARKEATAFLKPDVVEQTVVRLTFDSNGIVSQMDSVDKPAGAEFDIAKRVTPTEGHQLGFFEQIMGNIGRFNKAGDGGSVAPGRRPNSRGY